MPVDRLSFETLLAKLSNWSQQSNVPFLNQDRQSQECTVGRVPKGSLVTCVIVTYRSREWSLKQVSTPRNYFFSRRQSDERRTGNTGGAGGNGIGETHVVHAATTTVGGAHHQIQVRRGGAFYSWHMSFKEIAVLSSGRDTVDRHKCSWEQVKKQHQQFDGLTNKHSDEGVWTRFNARFKSVLLMTWLISRFTFFDTLAWELETPKPFHTRSLDNDHLQTNLIYSGM